MRDRLIEFLSDERGGAALEFALVYALAAVAGIAAIGAVQTGQLPLLSNTHRQIMQAVDEINRNLQ